MVRRLNSYVALSPQASITLVASLRQVERSIDATLVDEWSGLVEYFAIPENRALQEHALHLLSKLTTGMQVPHTMSNLKRSFRADFLPRLWSLLSGRARLSAAELFKIEWLIKDTLSIARSNQPPDNLALVERRMDLLAAHSLIRERCRTRSAVDRALQVAAHRSPYHLHRFTNRYFIERLAQRNEELPLASGLLPDYLKIDFAMSVTILKILESSCAFLGDIVAGRGASPCKDEGNVAGMGKISQALHEMRDVGMVFPVSGAGSKAKHTDPGFFANTALSILGRSMGGCCLTIDEFSRLGYLLTEIHRKTDMECIVDSKFARSSLVDSKYLLNLIARRLGPVEESKVI